MRICFIAHGRFTHIDAYLDYFSEHGHDVHLVALAPGPNRVVPTYNVGFGTGAKWSYLPAMLQARRIVRLLRPNVVHAHYATSAGLAAFVCSVHPYIVTAHGSDVVQGVKSIVWRSILGSVFRDADCVNPVSDELRELVLERGTPAQKVEILTLGIDTHLFKFSERPFSGHAAPLRLICTRRLESVYDHATIIKSLAIVSTRGINCVLTMVGDGIMRAELENLATRLGVRGRICFAGVVPNRMLPARLGEHDVYLSASTRDGTSLSLLEAMSAGLFPVVSNIKANAAWIRHGENGLLHRVSDPENLADCIGLVPREPGRAMDVLCHNRELIVRLGDRRTNMQKLEEIYQRLHMTRARN
jgi:glycosyltransferase involved in cell wall biosynthesis